MPARPAAPAVPVPPRWLWLLVAVPAAVLFCCYQYVDNAATTQHGMNVWRSLLEGRLLSFYSYNDAFTPESPFFWHFGSQYGFALYLVFALWDLPLFLAQHLAGINVFMNYPSLLWAKAITVPLLAGVVWATRRLAHTLGLPRHAWRWAALILVGAVPVLQTVVIMGQYDLLHVLPTMLAVDAWLRGRRRGFLGWFALAVAFKWFPLLVLLPLLLLGEKRLLRVLAQVALVLAPTLLLMVPFAFDPDRTVSGAGLVQQVLLASTLPLGHAVAPFVVAYGLACVLCWATPVPDAAQRRRWGLYAAAAPFTLLLLLTPAYPYWFVIPMPFWALVMVQQMARVRLLLVLETGWTVAMTAVHVVVFHFSWDWPTVAPMLLPRLFGGVERLAHNASFAEVLHAHGLDALTPLAASVGLACGVALLWFASPWARRVVEAEPVAAMASARGVLAVRTLAGLAFCSLAGATYLWWRVRYGLA